MLQIPPMITKKGNTFKARPIMCVSFANERKTHVKWVVVVRQITQRWVSANNTPPKRSPCHVQDLNEMIMKSMCLEISEKYNGNGHA